MWTWSRAARQQQRGRSASAATAAPRVLTLSQHAHSNRPLLLSCALGAVAGAAFTTNPAFLLCPSVGRVVTRSDDSGGGYTLCGQFVAVAEHVVVTARHVCVAQSGMQRSLKLLWRPDADGHAPGPGGRLRLPMRVLSAAVLESDEEMDMALLVVLDADAPPFTPLPLADASVIHAHTSDLLCGLSLFAPSRDYRLLGWSASTSPVDLALLPSFEESTVQGVNVRPPPAADPAAAAAAAAGAAHAAASPPYLVGMCGYRREAGYSGGAVVGVVDGQMCLLGIHTHSKFLGSREGRQRAFVAAEGATRSIFVVAHSALTRRGWQLPELVAAAAQRRQEHAQAQAAAPAPAADPEPFHIVRRDRDRAPDRRRRRDRSRSRSRDQQPFDSDQLYDL